jgi:hypothetical protein
MNIWIDYGCRSAHACVPFEFVGSSFTVARFDRFCIHARGSIERFIASLRYDDMFMRMLWWKLAYGVYTMQVARLSIYHHMLYSCVIIAWSSGSFVAHRNFDLLNLTLFDPGSMYRRIVASCMCGYSRERKRVCAVCSRVCGSLLIRIRVVQRELNLRSFQNYLVC